MRKSTVFITTSLCIALGACAPSVPDNPTWEDDVKPILAANCVRCHTVPAIQFAPPNFRLDVAEDTMVDGQMVMGAAFMIDRVIARGTGADGVPPMPPLPARGLNDRQLEVLQNWADSGAPASPGITPVLAPAHDVNSAEGFELHELLNDLHQAHAAEQ